MRAILFASFILLPVSIMAGDWVQTLDMDLKVPTKTLVDSDIASSTLDFTVPGYELETIDINGKDFSSITVPELNNLNEKGMPSLPKLTASVIIPAEAAMSYRILEEDCHVEAVGPIVPAKGTVYRNQNPALVPYSFSKFYQSSDVYPRSSVSLSEPFVVRGVRGLTVQYYPFQYLAESQEVRICSRARVALYADGISTHNVVSADLPASATTDFSTIYDKLFLNYQTYLADDEKHDVPEQDKLLIIAHDRFAKEIQPLVEWKLQKGVATKLVLTSAISSTPNTQPTPQDIKKFIQSEYDLRGISHILLVGDAEELKPFPGTSGNVVGKEADPMYVLLAGNDSYPDAFISRFSGETPEHIRTQVERSVSYERQPELSDWYNKAMGLAGDDKGGNPSYADWERADFLRTELLKYPFASVDQFYHRPLTAPILDAFRQGRGFVNYINHGSTTSWPIGSITTSVISQMDNYNRLPFIVSVACVNGKFAGGTCLGEAFLRAGTPGKPAGAIAVYASSTNQSWVPPCIGQRRVTDLLVARKKLSIGGLFMNGVIATLEDGESSAVQTYQSWHVFGDGSITSRTTKPEMLKVEHPEVLSKSAGNLPVTVEKTAGALVSIYADGVNYGAVTTDAKGVALIPLKDCGCSRSRKMTLTVTGFNKVPYITTLAVVD